MAPKKINTADVSKGDYRDYRSKGLEFFGVMKICLQDREWDAVLLNGVHAAISLSDAVTVFKLGKRSTGRSHQDAMILLSQAVAQNEEDRKNAGRLGDILNYKHTAEYESRRSTEREAHDFAKLVERFIGWAQKRLP